MDRILALGAKAGALLKTRRETIAVSESSTGGLISAALLSVPGASAYFVGGGVIYTQGARRAFLQLADEAMRGMRGASEPYALLSARTARDAAPLSGVSAKPAPPVRPATAMATRPDTPVSR